MFWMLLSQALTIPNPVTCSGSLLNFKKFQRDEARGNVGVLQVRKAEEAHGSQGGLISLGKGLPGVLRDSACSPRCAVDPFSRYCCIKSPRPEALAQVPRKDP